MFWLPTKQWVFDRKCVLQLEWYTVHTNRCLFRSTVRWSSVESLRALGSRRSERKWLFALMISFHSIFENYCVLLFSYENAFLLWQKAESKRSRCQLCGDAQNTHTPRRTCVLDFKFEVNWKLNCSGNGSTATATNNMSVDWLVVWLVMAYGYVMTLSHYILSHLRRISRFCTHEWIFASAIG